MLEKYFQKIKPDDVFVYLTKYRVQTDGKEDVLGGGRET